MGEEVHRLSVKSKALYYKTCHFSSSMNPLFSFFISPSLSEMTEDQLACQTSPSNVSTELPVTIKYGDQERRLEGSLFRYTLDPNITFAEPPKSFLRYRDSACTFPRALCCGRQVLQHCWHVCCVAHWSDARPVGVGISRGVGTWARQS